MVIWLTGHSGAGKSTITRAILRRLPDWIVLEGETVRSTLRTDLVGHGKAARAESLRFVTQLAKLLSVLGHHVIVDYISPLDSYRKDARGLIGDHSFLLVHVDTPVELCRLRDPKGLYSGGAQDLPGVDAPYETPEDADITIDTTETAPEAAAMAIFVAARTKANDIWP